MNSAPNLNGTGLVNASGNKIIVITINYRVGLYGFLTDGDEISPNNGLLDQRKAMEWVQQYIAQFGGVSTSCVCPKRPRMASRSMYGDTCLVYMDALETRRGTELMRLHRYTKY